MGLHELVTMTAADAGRRIAAGALDPADLVDACLDRIREREPDVLAWVHVDEDGARRTARQRYDEARSGHVRGPLHGVPVGVKDNIHVAGMPTACGAAEFAHVWPDDDATCVARLRAAGAVIVGKTTATEFAYLEPSQTRNPWNTAHTPGGSSSGSAAAVASNMVPLALGTQTVGSVLRPAAYCGIVGFKGTHAAMPTDGIVPLAGQSLDHAGVLARSVEDVALGFGVMAGPVAGGAGSSPPRVAVVPEIAEHASADMAARLSAAAERLADAGASVTQVRLPTSFAGIHDAGHSVLAGEFAAAQAHWFQAHAGEYRDRTRKLIETGLSQHTVDYVRAQDARAQFRRDMVPVLAGVDALLLPTAGGTAPVGLDSTGDPWFCGPWTSIGVPAISLPDGLSGEGLPHAVQLVGAGGGDGDLLAVAAWCERVLDGRHGAGDVGG